MTKYTSSNYSEMPKSSFFFLHGAWYGSWSWNKVCRNLGIKLEENTLDYPNYHKNGWESPISLDTYVDSAYKKITQLKSKPILVGHSMSGAVLSRYASKYPETVSGLIYIAAFLLENKSIYDFISQRPNDSVGAKKTYKQIKLGKNQFEVAIIDQESLKERFCHDCDDFNDFKGLFSSFTPTSVIKEKIQVNADFRLIPKYYVKCENDRAISLFEQNKMINECDSLPKSNVYSLSSSHSPFLSKPVELCSLLKKIKNNIPLLETV